MTKQKGQTNRYPIDTLVSLAEEFFAMGKRVKLVAVGHSMEPMLKSDRDAVILEKFNKEPLKKGEVALFRRKNGSFALHRVISFDEKEGYTFLGDFQLTPERGITEDMLIAKAVAYEIKGRLYTEDSLRCRFFSRFWVNTIFWRKVWLKLRRLLKK